MHTHTRIRRLLAALLLTALCLPGTLRAADPFDHSNLAAWCIVPFDAAKRGPEQRAAMLEKLGIHKFVYDYRKEHIPQWDDEMAALKRHHIELLGWWFPGSLNDEARLALDLFKRHGLSPQLWISGGGGSLQAPDAAEQKARVEREVTRLLPLCEAAAAIGSKIGLYNHGGWYGEPENALAILDALHSRGIRNAGLVYNLHHGHGHLARLEALLPRMLPELLCFNLNGMDPGGDAVGRKILPLGIGSEDLRLLSLLKKSGYNGPVGILNHTGEDAEGRLLDNLEGLDWLRAQLNGAAPAPRPALRTWKPAAAAPAAPTHAPTATAPPASTNAPQLVPSAAPEFGTALKGGIVAEGSDLYRTLPLTVECLARLESQTNFNILVASDPKNSADHWELYTYRGSGFLSLYLPGRGGEFRSSTNICDGKWHDLAAEIDEKSVRLHVDGNLVLERDLQPRRGDPRPGGLAIGRLVEGGIGCDGLLDDVRISRGRVKLQKELKPRIREDVTLTLWNFSELPAPQPASQPASKPAPNQPPQPAPFTGNRAPLRPQDWPHAQHPVNRDRIYDFYAKQAAVFRAQNPAPTLLPQFPGMDGGTQGHWGNQNDTVWKDGRWNQTDLGGVMGGVFRNGKLTVPKAVCVQLGDPSVASVCFDPQSASFPVAWQGGFVEFSEARHGFGNGIKPRGTQLPTPVPAQSPATTSNSSTASIPPDALYRGFLRRNGTVTFLHQLGDRWWQQSPRLDDKGSPVIERSETAPDLKALAQDLRTQWPQWLETKGTLGNGSPYALDTLTLPHNNPWKTLFFVSGCDFLPNGDAAICTMTGEVWLCRGIDAGLATLRWKRFATGLHQPLGLKVVDGIIHVLGRDQLTRLHDINGDDEADFYECLTNAQTTSAGGHDYITGCERDDKGRWYFASGNQGLCRVAPGQPVEVLATGLRNPNGLGLAPDGTLTSSVQEGNWTPASAICQVPPDDRTRFFGYGGPKPGQPVDPPLLYLPRGVDNSSGGQCFVHSQKWGPLDGQLLHFSPGSANHFLILREQIDGVWQGAAVPLPGDFRSGVQQARISPHDGQLYATGLSGWGVYAPDDGCFQRVRYTGAPAHLPVHLETRENGILLRFSDPLEKTVASDAARHFAQCWDYHYSGAYGSSEFSLRNPQTPGHDPLPIRSAHLTDDRTLFLEIPLLTIANQIHLRIALTKDLERDVFLTAHRLGKPFTQFPGYRAEPKQTLRPSVPTVITTTASKANPWAAGAPGRTISIDAALGMQFAQTKLSAKRGERLSITFRNPDQLPHNFVLLKPGRLQAVGEAANKLVTDPQGFARHYVPESPEVLAYTDMVNPGGAFTIHLNAPQEPGAYPYLCSFPGHWAVMNGVLTVE